MEKIENSLLKYLNILEKNISIFSANFVIEELYGRVLGDQLENHYNATGLQPNAATLNALWQHSINYTKVRNKMK